MGRKDEFEKLEEGMFFCELKNLLEQYGIDDKLGLTNGATSFHYLKESLRKISEVPELFSSEFVPNEQN